MIDSAFGNWLAGFIDGEGCFTIVSLKQRPLGFRPSFSIAVRADDASVIYEIAKRTELGKTHFYQGQSGHAVIRWVISSRSDCAALVLLLTKYPLRAKKANDFEVWKQAVQIASTVKLGRAQDNSKVRNELCSLKQELYDVRRKGLLSADSRF